MAKATRPRRRPSHVGSDSTIDLLTTDDQVTPEGVPANVQALSVANEGTPTTAEIKKGNKKDEPTSLDIKPKRKSKTVGTTKAPSPTFTKKKKPASKATSADSVFMLDKPTPPPTLGKVDPIAEAPKRVWYFRSRELGERGPLKAKEMQKYVDSGDVKIGCIVWREDWEDWIEAEAVFPHLAAEAKALRQKDMVNRAFKDANYKIPDEFDPNSAINKKRRLKNYIFAGAIAAGILVIGGLVLVLVKLLSN